MEFKIVVLAKQVPDTRNVGPDAMTPEGTINRAALPAVFNPEDLNALEMALQAKEQIPGATVTVLTMGPDRAAAIVKESLYRGADNGYVISDRRFAGSDTLATSYALSAAIQHMGDVKLVFGGRQAIDGDTAQVGPQVAEKLNMPQITYATKLISASAEKLVIQRAVAQGLETVECTTPALVTVCAEAGECRFRHAHLLLKHRNTEVGIWTADDINPDFERLGLSGSPTKVKKVDNVVLSQKENMQVENNQDAINSLMSTLVTNHIIG